VINGFLNGENNTLDEVVVIGYGSVKRVVDRCCWRIKSSTIRLSK
jgi:hypothetical protein